MKGDVIPGSIKVSKLISRILEGEIKIPPFQREFVWSEEQVVELLDSIYKDYPIGSVLLWETNETLKSQREIGGFKIPEKRPELPWIYVLDGQQRITSIFGVFCDRKIKVTNEELAAKFNLVFDFENKSFKYEDEITSSSLIMPLQLIFDNYAFNMFMTKDNRFDQATTKEAAKLQSTFQNYELPTVTITKRKKEEVSIMFERVNSTGTPLSTLDLLTAWTWTEEYYLKEIFDNIFDLLESKNFGNFKDKLILQCFCAMISESTKTKDILVLDPKMVRDSTPKLIESIEKAIDLLSTELNVSTEEFLPKPQQFVGLVYLYSRIPKLTAEQLDTVTCWFWRTSFSNRYSAGTDERMNEDIAFFKQISQNNFSGLEKYKSALKQDIFSEKTLVKTNYWSKATLLLMASQTPLDLTNGQKIELGTAMSTFNRKEYHHIFPRTFLKEKWSLSTPEINRLANFCFLPSGSNKNISKKAPSDYFFNLIPKGQKQDILRSNIVPHNDNIYKNNDYKQFIDERSNLLLKIAKQLTKE